MNDEWVKSEELSDARCTVRFSREYLAVAETEKPSPYVEEFLDEEEGL